MNSATRELFGRIPKTYALCGREEEEEPLSHLLWEEEEEMGEEW
jgi:hypothetical protein